MKKHENQSITYSSSCKRFLRAEHVLSTNFVLIYSFLISLFSENAEWFKSLKQSPVTSELMVQWVLIAKDEMVMPRSMISRFSSIREPKKELRLRVAQTMSQWMKLQNLLDNKDYVGISKLHNVYLDGIGNTSDHASVAILPEENSLPRTYSSRPKTNFKTHNLQHLK